MGFTKLQIDKLVESLREHLKAKQGNLIADEATLRSIVKKALPQVE